jgi:hypothetical protein
LPAAAPPTNNRNRVVAAIIVAIVAAVLGFFGVRLIADAATADAAPAAPMVISTAPVAAMLPATA